MTMDGTHRNENIQLKTHPSLVLTFISGGWLSTVPPSSLFPQPPDSWCLNEVSRHAYSSKTTRSAAQRQHDRAREVPGLTGVLRMLQTGWEAQTWPTVEPREVSILIVSFAKP